MKLCSVSQEKRNSDLSRHKYTQQVHTFQCTHTCAYTLTYPHARTHTYIHTHTHKHTHLVHSKWFLYQSI